MYNQYYSTAANASSLQEHISPLSCWQSAFLVNWGRTDKNKTGSMILPDCKATECQTILYWHSNRHTDQWNSTDNPQNASMYWCLNDPRTHNWKRVVVSLVIWIWEMDVHMQNYGFRYMSHMLNKNQVKMHLTHEGKTWNCYIWKLSVGK